MGLNRISMTNNLYCIIIQSGHSHLDEEFTSDAESYLDNYDRDCIAGYDIGNESIYFLYIPEWKVFRIIDFFKRNHILLKYELVTNIFDFLSSDVKFLVVYSEARNKNILDNYIINTVTIDTVLDRMNSNRNTKGFSLFQIEMSILGIDYTCTT